ncbi:hypothetical protein AN665_0219225 [Serratia marcescens]|nr:hypothetical protein AN665_0219225 [Serratia marcescens]
MISDANKAVNDLASIVPLLGGSSSRKDYEEARKLVEYLLEHDPDSPRRCCSNQGTIPQFGDLIS